MNLAIFISLNAKEIIGLSQTIWWSRRSSKLVLTAIDESNDTMTELIFFKTAGAFLPQVN